MDGRTARGISLEWRGLSRLLVLASLLGPGSLSCAARAPSIAPTPPPVAANAAPVAATTAQPVAAKAELSYALTQGSIGLLGTLKKTLRIDAYLPKHAPRTASFVSDLTALLRAYQDQSKGKLELRLIEATSDEQRQQARQDGLVEHVFADGNESGSAGGFLGLAFKYGNERAVIPQLPYDDASGLEFWVTNKIREIRDRADGVKHRIGVVTGKDELKLSDAYLMPKAADGNAPTIKGVLLQAFPFYQIEEVDLRHGSGEIDPELVGLIITQPQKDYTAAELGRIDAFLMRGEKSLVVYASAVNLKASDPSMLATLSTHGLDTLLDGYGIHMNKDAVFDYGTQFRVPLMTSQGQSVFLRHCGIAVAQGVTGEAGAAPMLDSGFAGFFRMEEVVLPFPSSLELARDKQPADVTLRVVARSTPAASVERTQKVDMKLREVWQPKPPQQQRILAAYAQGKLKSAFAGKPGASPTTPERALGSSRVLVVSSSLFLTNPFAYAGNAPPGASSGDAELLLIAQPYTKYLTATILSVKNTLDWMTNDEDLMALSAQIIPHEKGPR